MSKKSYTDVKKDQSVATVILIEGLCRKSSSRHKKAQEAQMIFLSFCAFVPFCGYLFYDSVS